MTLQTWKTPHILKGMLTYVPVLNTWRARHGVTGGSTSSRYCYAVWLRHLVTLDRQGFTIKGASVGELGPGDSIGTGLTALLFGAHRYVGLDVVPYSANADLQRILTELAEMCHAQEPIPNHDEFPGVRPRLASYDFPGHLIQPEALAETVARLEADLRHKMPERRFVNYCAPWTGVEAVASGSLDLIFSQAVLQMVDDLEETYRAMFSWLKPGGWSSHSIACTSHYLSPFWNGHWAYTDLEWRVVRGRRKYLLNREPIGTHLRLARKVGFEIVHLDRQWADDGLNVEALAPRFRALESDDRRTHGAMLILRRPMQS